MPGVSALDVRLAVAAGSVVVDATIEISAATGMSMSAGDVLVDVLSDLTTDELSSATGTTVLSIEAPVLQWARATLSETPPAPPSPREHATVITHHATVGGALSDFNASQYRKGLASLLPGVSALDVRLAVAAGSVVVDATIEISAATGMSMSAGDVLVDVLSDLTTDELSSATGTTVLSIEAPVLQWARATLSETPPAPPSPPLAAPSGNSATPSPPSPPAFAYQAVTLASAISISLVFFAISVACCFGFASKTARDRHASPLVGVVHQRADKAANGRREMGESPRDDASRPDDAQPSERAVTGFSFKGLAGRYDAVKQ